MSDKDSARQADISLPSRTSLDSAFQSIKHEQWVEAVIDGLRDGQSPEDLNTHTLDGISINTLYAACSTAANLPDEFQTSWDNRLHLADTDNPAQANRRLLDGLGGGITSVEIHTHDPAVLGAVLDAVNLDIAPISVRAGQHYVQSSQVLQEFANSNGFKAERCAFSYNADPLGTALHQGGTDQSLDTLLDTMTQFCLQQAEASNTACTVLADGAIHHNAGASPVQELVATVSTGALYLEKMLAAGVVADKAVQQIGFQMALDSNTLTGVAKLRALRVLWRHVACACTGLKPEHIIPAIVAETSRRQVSTLDPWNTHLRNLCAAMAAALASVPTILVHPHPGEQTTLNDRMARNLPIIIEREAGLRRVFDPMSGSYAVESLTSELVDAAWAQLVELDTGAQWIDELQQGRWQQRLHDTHQQRVQRLHDNSTVMVGVNRYPPPETHRLPALDTVAAEPQASRSHPWPALHAVRDAQAFESTVAEAGA